MAVSAASTSLRRAGCAAGQVALSTAHAPSCVPALSAASPVPARATARPQQRLPCPTTASRRQVLYAGAPLLPLLLRAGGCAPLLAPLLPPPPASRAAGVSRVVASAMSTDAGSGAGVGATHGSSPTGAIVVYVTVPSAEVGESLASKLVESKLAACVNIVPGLTSVYWWDGKVNKDPELLLIIKTREELLSQLTAFVRANHPYDEPEVVGLPILGGSPSYLKWLKDSASGPQPGGASA